MRIPTSKVKAASLLVFLVAIGLSMVAGPCEPNPTPLPTAPPGSTPTPLWAPTPGWLATPTQPTAREEVAATARPEAASGTPIVVATHHPPTARDAEPTPRQTGRPEGDRSPRDISDLAACLRNNVLNDIR